MLHIQRKMAQAMASSNVLTYPDRKNITPNTEEMQTMKPNVEMNRAADNTTHAPDTTIICNKIKN